MASKTSICKTRAPRLYINQALGIGGTIILPEITSHHVLHVLRQKSEDQLVLFNGLGGEYRGIVSAITRNRVEISIIQSHDVDRESPLEITLGLSILKRDAMNTAIQKATELGVTHIVPVETVNTSVSRKKFEKRHEHWHQIIRSACEQCGRTRLPTLDEVHSFAGWIDTAQGELKLLASLRSPRKLSEIQTAPHLVCLLIGPEGGISEEEEIAAVNKGFEPVSAGSRVLRAETVPTALLSLIQFRWGDF